MTTISARPMFHGILRLGSGEFLTRILYVAIVIILGHAYGVSTLGVYGLAISVTQYLVPFIDFGLRHIGARLIARFPRSASEIVELVQRRRLLMAISALPLIFLYAALVRTPFDTKVFLFLFSSIGVLYVFSLEWTAWGREQMLLVGMAKGVIPACVLAALLIALAAGHLFPWLVVGNLVGYVLQGGIFWWWWHRHRGHLGDPERGVADISEALFWRRTSVMGLAWLGNMAFNTSDMLILGAFSNTHEVGLYTAAYRILNQFLATYYLLTNVLYPQLARQDSAQRRRMLSARIFLLLFAAGVFLAIPLSLFRRPVLALLFGKRFVEAAPLLLVLTCCLPLDFLVSYLSNAYLAWNMERRVLVCAAGAAGVNVVLNLATIPRFGAMAAAVNTVLSYIIYLGALAWPRKPIALEART